MNEELKVFITAEIDGLKKEVQNAQDEIKNLEKTGKDSGGKFGNAMKAMGKAVGTAMKAVGAAIAAGITAIVALGESTREFRTEQAKLTTAFDAAGHSAETATKVYDELFGVIGEYDQATEAAQQIALLADSEEEAIKWAELGAGVIGRFGDALQPEAFYEAANETLKLGEATGAYTQMLEQAGVDVDEFNAGLAACNTEAEKQAYIYEVANGVLGEASDTYRRTAEDVIAANNATLNMTEAMAGLGAVVEPIITVFKNGLANVLKEITPYLQMVATGIEELVATGDASMLEYGIIAVLKSLTSTIQEMLPTLLSTGTSLIVALIEGIAGSLPQMVSTIIEAIPQLVDALLGMLPTLIDCGVQIILAILQGLGTAIPQIIQSVVDIIPTLVDSLIANIPLLLEGAISFLMAIVQAIPEIIPPLIEALPGLVQSIVDSLVENLPLLIDGAIQLFMGLTDAIPAIIPPLMEALPQIVMSIVGGLIRAIPDLLAGALQFFGAIIDAIITVGETVIQSIVSYVKGWIEALGTFIDDLKGWGKDLVEKVKEAWENVKTSIKEKIEEAKQNVMDTFEGIKTGIQEKIDNVKERISSVFSNIKDTIKSKITDAKNNVLSIFDSIKNGIQTKIQSARDTVKNVIDKIKGFFKFEWSLPKLKMPHISITGKFSLNPLQTPKFRISWNKLGGVFDDPTLFNYGGTLQGIGEDGAEAVVPLEKNTQWLDRIAEMLNDKQGTRPIVLQVDGKTFAQVSVDSINALTRQRGTLGINIV